MPMNHYYCWLVWSVKCWLGSAAPASSRIFTFCLLSEAYTNSKNRKLVNTTTLHSIHTRFPLPLILQKCPSCSLNTFTSASSSSNTLPFPSPHHTHNTTITPNHHHPPPPSISKAASRTTTRETPSTTAHPLLHTQPSNPPTKTYSPHHRTLTRGSYHLTYLPWSPHSVSSSPPLAAPTPSLSTLAPPTLTTATATTTAPSPKPWYQKEVWEWPSTPWTLTWISGVQCRKWSIPASWWTWEKTGIISTSFSCATLLSISHTPTGILFVLSPTLSLTFSLRHHRRSWRPATAGNPWTGGRGVSQGRWYN